MQYTKNMIAGSRYPLAIIGSLRTCSKVWEKAMVQHSNHFWNLLNFHCRTPLSTDGSYLLPMLPTFWLSLPAFLKHFFSMSFLICCSFVHLLNCAMSQHSAFSSVLSLWKIPNFHLYSITLRSKSLSPSRCLSWARTASWPALPDNPQAPQAYCPGCSLVITGQISMNFCRLIYLPFLSSHFPSGLCSLL